VPELSIVVPTLGRSAKLRRALDRLEAQTLPPDRFEVIVATDPEEPDAAGVASAVADRPFQARLVERHAPGAAAARNSGWHEAAASLVLFTDDDVLAGPRLLEEHLAWHRREPADEVGVLGHVRWARELRVTTFMRWLERGIQFDYRGIRGTEAGWGRFYTANVSVKRRLLVDVGGFEESLPFGYEDLELAYRLHLRGLRLLYNRKAKAEHLHAMTLESWKQRVALVARAERRFVELHPEIPPYFLRLFEAAASAPPARGRGTWLAPLVPAWLPWLGPKVWASVDMRYRQALMPYFLEAWRHPGQAAGGQ
jgi:GT2 family glycosyltransferase